MKLKPQFQALRYSKRDMVCPIMWLNFECSAFFTYRIMVIESGLKDQMSLILTQEMGQEWSLSVMCYQIIIISINIVISWFNYYCHCEL